MENRASIPPGLPRPSPTLSYWQDPPDPIADNESTAQLPEFADVVIIGSGISGSSVAYNVLEKTKDASVLLLEARQAASGASGRNGGHTKGASYRSFLENVAKLGEEEALKIVHLEYNCMVAVHRFAETGGIACDAKQHDTVDVFYDQGEWEQAHESVFRMRKLMSENDPAAHYKFWTAEETASKFLAPHAMGSLSYEAGSLSAYKLVIGILRLALKKGLNLQCHTPVISITKTSEGNRRGRWIVETARGNVSAYKVVLATNGYTAHLYPKLQDVIVPLRGVVTAQRPGKNMSSAGLETSYSFIYKHGFDYMIARPQGSKLAGDIVIGGGLTKAAEEGLGEIGNNDDTVLNDDIVEYLADSTAYFFGKNWGDDDPEGRVRRAWSGIMGYSGDGFPLIGPIPGEDGLFIDASFQGHGMVLCFLCAQALTQMLLGEEDEKLDAWFPKAYRMTEARFEAKLRGALLH